MNQVEHVLDSLKHAGIRLTVTKEHALAVRPASQLTFELRQVIRDSKKALVAWLTEHSESEADTTLDWKAFANAYHAHHFNCPTCIAAGQGRGLRCGVGMSLWTTYNSTAR
jgi:hypothetical protein